MTPAELDAYLSILRANGAQSAVLRLPGGAEVHVNFAPPPEATYQDVTPGGWKTPTWSTPEELEEEQGE